MWGVIWYFFTIAWSWHTLQHSVLVHTLSAGELAAAAVAVAAVGGAWLVYIVAILMQGLQVDTLLVTAVIMLGFSWWQRRNPATPPSGAGSSGSARRLTRGDDVLVACVTTLCAYPLWYLYSLRMLPEDEAGNILTGASCYGDLPIHMQIANSFLVGVNQRVRWGTGMMSPIFAGVPMTYPFLPDFHAAVLVRAGSSMRAGFLWPGFTLATALVALLLYFGIRLTRSRLGAVLGMVMTVCAGGMGGPRWWQSAGYETMLREDVIQHDPEGQWMMLWFAFIPHILLPQRGATFAYPLAVLVLILVWISTDASVRMPVHIRAQHLLFAAGFAAALPMMQAHAFIGLAIIIGVMFVLDAHKWLRDVRLLSAWALAGILAIALAYPQMAQFQKTASEGFHGKFMEWGWIYQNPDPIYRFGRPHGIVGFFRFWWHSLAAAWPLFVLAGVAAIAETFVAHRMAVRLAKDHGTGAVASHIAAVASEIGYDADSADHDRSSPPSSRSRLAATGASASASISTSRHVAPSAVQRALGWLDAVIIPLTNAVHVQRLHWFDELVAPMNAFSVTGRALDTIKLVLGALGVFLLGNYLRMQPWDRDNAKIFYIWVFCAAPLNGALIAAPIEYVLGWQPGRARFGSWFSGFQPRTAAPQPPAKSAAVQRSPVLTLAAAVGSLGALALFGVSILSGIVLLVQETRNQSILLDQDALQMGDFIKENVPAGAVIMHSNFHLQPSGAIAGRPSMVSYYGWVSNHGYNADERLGDRDYAMDNALKDSDERAYQLMRKWGVRYVVGEHIRRHDRPRERAYRRAVTAREHDPSAPLPPDFDPDVYLDGQLRRVFSSGRYELFEVLGYNFPAPTGN